MFDLLRHPGFTLLGYGVTHETLASITEGTSVRCHTIGASGYAIRDDHEQIRKHYGLYEGALVLIRPDGYVGARADASTAHGLRDLICQWVGRIRLAMAD